MYVDLPVRDSRDGSRERLHAGAHVSGPLPGCSDAHVSGPLPGCRSSDTFSDGAHSSERRGRPRLPLDRRRRRKLSHAATLRGRYAAVHAAFTPTLDNQLSKKATELRGEKLNYPTRVKYAAILGLSGCHPSRFCRDVPFPGPSVPSPVVILARTPVVPLFSVTPCAGCT